MLSADPSSLSECQGALSKGLLLPLHGSDCIVIKTGKGLSKALLSPTSLVFIMMIIPSWNPYLTQMDSLGSLQHAKHLAASALSLFLICWVHSLIPSFHHREALAPLGQSELFELPPIVTSKGTQWWCEMAEQITYFRSNRRLFRNEKSPVQCGGRLSSWIQI